MRGPIPKISNNRSLSFNAINNIDFYKSSHRVMYPAGTETVYSNFTPRSTKHLNVEKDLYDGKVVFFGLQAFIKSFLQDSFNESFFGRPLDVVLKQYKRRMDTSLFTDFDVSHIAALHNLGYLPIRIKALPEGVKVKPGIPVFTIVNTLPEFYWLTNYLESVLSAEIWKKMVNATIASHYRGIGEKYAIETGAPLEFVFWQFHDFSFRGMSGSSDAAMSGMSHLTSFYGTDTVPAIDAAEIYYGANADNEIVGGSVPASEHSCSSSNVLTDFDSVEFAALEAEFFVRGQHLPQTGPYDKKLIAEYGFIKRMVTELFPAGIVSIVSDTYDFWAVLTEILPRLKPEIIAREGKVVVRPDSGNPVLIVCGDPDAPIGSNEWKGAIRILDEQFGSTTTEKEYKVLDSHIGLIYGDSITPKRANQILKNLVTMGYASCNCVFGVGSYSLNYSTRDSIGGAMKSTFVVVNGERRAIFKDPKTDNGTKKSARGLLRVELIDGEYVLFDDQTEDQEKQGALEIVFEDGILLKEVTLAEIRTRLIKY